MADKTTRPNLTPSSPDKTTRPNNAPSFSDKTIRPGMDLSSNDKTTRPSGILSSAAKTIRPSADDIQKVVSGIEREYVIDGKRYRYQQTLSNGTGEGDILLVEHGGKKYVLKLYIEGIKITNPMVLSQVRKLRGSGLLVNLYNFGTWTHPTTKQQRDYELMEYCEGGDLTSVNINGDEKRFKQLAVMMAAAIDFCHQHGFIHGDIKPANFMFTDKSQKHLVLSDFGISLTCNNNGSVRTENAARTKIYAAPEFYLSIPGSNEREIYTSSDYYSLGMTLLTLWMGEQTFKQQEWELMSMKIKGKIKYPEDLSDYSLSLIKALTKTDPAERCTFSDIEKWAKGEKVFEEQKKKSDINKRDFYVLFNAGKQQEAHSPEELAQLMLKEQTLATKYLYNGQVEKWLQANLRPELETEIKDIVENRSPNSQKEGLFFACYALDPALPYYDVNGNPCTSGYEIGMAILNNTDKYLKSLTSLDDLLYVFLQTHDLEDLADELYYAMGSDGDNQLLGSAYDKLMETVYTLDPQLPYIIKTDDGSVVTCNTLDDIIRAEHYRWHNNNKMMHDLKTSWFVNIWVGQRSKVAYQRIKKIIDENDKNDYVVDDAVLYCLNPAISYNFELDTSSTNYYMTYQQVAQLFNYYYNQRQEGVGATKYYNYQIDDSFMQIGKKSQLYYYFKSKGSYDDKIDWIKYCFELDSKDNKKKAGPYNKTIAFFKALKGLGISPCYRTKKGKNLYSLSDVRGLKKSERDEELANGLKDYLTIFFQEDPALDKSKKYNYEKATIKYLEFLDQLSGDIEEVKRYKEASQNVKGLLSDINRTYAKLLITRIMIALLCFVPLISLAVLLCVLGLPFEGNPLKGNSGSFIEVCTIILFLPVCLLTEFEGKIIGEIILSAILSAAVYGLLYLLMSILVPAAPYLIAALLIAFAVVIYIKCYRQFPLKRNTKKQLNSTNFEQLYVEPLHYAYDKTKSKFFDSSISTDIYNYSLYLGEAFKKLLLFAIPTILFTVGLFWLMIWLTPHIVSKQANVNQQTANMVGKWTGKFGDKKSTIDFKTVTPDYVEAYVHVPFSQMSNERVAGSINIKKKTMVLDDIHKNGILDGKYNCTFTDTDNVLSQIEGTYYNPKSGKRIEFTYARKLKPEELAFEEEMAKKTFWQIWLGIFQNKFHISTEQQQNNQ